ncbi:saccharopine dehydrogenase (NADP+, L-glutamate-forming) [Saccharomycopsis crataegensis]|uniref:Saccharopine dehydrogenase [NADP(+), L-glutamate-forming] n=1 Tax=Saccharomycopsis crataegensis TaxID=43959 RepID=A0AAV5QKR9_9ASCO|nr:saccharopine dehydrogenase (NADP+, L-glutamate-forming) [Saccharomycopsis crataegensis]
MAQKVLLLGTGFVAKPTVDILAATEGVEVTVGSRTLASAQKLTEGNSAKAISVDVNDEKALDAEVAKVDVVISLIPYIYHATVVKSAIRNKTNVVTTSYISDALKALEPEIKAAGITVMNEIGLDPGIDHLYAVKTIDEVHQVGGKIKSFLSYCGGLPAPEDSDNPLGYKFSWSSRGVLLALRNSAKYYQDGELCQITGEQLMATAKPYHIYPGYAFVCYPNRDSTQYKQLYNIPEAETVIRGTLRYQGFPEFIKALVDIGFLKEDPIPELSSAIPWNQALAIILGIKSTKTEDLIAAIESKTKFPSASEKERILNGFKWLGLFSETPIIPRGNPLDTLCATLEELMQYGPTERDLVVLQHKFGIEWADGTTETRTSTLVDYGVVGGYTSMAKTVGVPCAVATLQVLDGTISDVGLVAPHTPKIVYPLLKTLKEKYDIYLTEKTL